MVVGLSWEVLFAIVRKLEVNEGFFVTGILFPLILPPTTPLWQAALGISFGVVFAKEIFGGTGMNFINPGARRARVPVLRVSGRDLRRQGLDRRPAGLRGRRLLRRDAARADAADDRARSPTMPHSWWTAFVGLEPGSMGETSALACLIGAALLIGTGIGSWRTMAGVTLGTIAMALVFNAIGSTTNHWYRGAVLVAHGRRRLGVRHRVHGHRPGDLAVHRHAASGSTAC